MDKNLFSAALCCIAVSLLLSPTLSSQGKSSSKNASGRPVEIRLGTPASSLLPDKTVLLYPKGQNAKKGLKEAEGPMLSNELQGPEVAEKNGFLANVTDSARMDLYFPKKSNGQMVVVCPGGSYFDLSTWNEGIYTAKWMTEHGITACVLKYRFLMDIGKYLLSTFKMHSDIAAPMPKNGAWTK
jgi:hypothetical protein